MTTKDIIKPVLLIAANLLWLHFARITGDHFSMWVAALMYGTFIVANAAIAIRLINKNHNQNKHTDK